MVIVPKGDFHLFSGYGIELEYMIVDKNSLCVLPRADAVLLDSDGTVVNELDQGATAWSNELAAHVIEVKSHGAVTDLAAMQEEFKNQIREINRILGRHGACLLPTAMHPFMDPHADTVLWQYDDKTIYNAFDAIFNCRGHGWSNLQSTHINLPFCGDSEFARLHAAVRMVLPVIPALAASSPYMDATAGANLDNRLSVYANNAKRIPSLSASIIPEAVFSRREYENSILEPIYADLVPYDPAGILRYEWVNARGAIARFDRQTIEIRIVDIQECISADMAIVYLITELVRAMAGQQWISLDEQKRWPTFQLRQIYNRCVKKAENAVIHNREYLAAFGLDREQIRAGDLWSYLMAVLDLEHQNPAWAAFGEIYTRQGTLARRLLDAAGEQPRRDTLTAVYGKAAACLRDDICFQGAPGG